MDYRIFLGMLHERVPAECGTCGRVAAAAGPVESWTWTELQRSIVGEAIEQWRMYSCVRAEGGHFEHSHTRTVVV